MMKKWISTGILTGFLFLGVAKDFKYASPIQTNHSKGYQQIDLSPQILGLVHPNFSDLRLLDSNQNEVPYILRKESLVSMHSFFKEYPMITNAPQPNGTSVIVFENPNKEELTQVNFVVKNNAVNKSARLSGSDDQKNWFLIRDHIHLNSMHNAKETTELKLLNFPKTDYAYYKLEINDSNSLPIQFEKIGYYDYQNVDGLMATIPLNVKSQKDSNQVSYVHLQFDQKTRFERIRIQITGAEFYYRSIHFKVKETRTNRKGKKQTYFQNIGSFKLNSNTENTFELGQHNLQDIYIEIENGDDQPLQMSQVEAYLLKNYMVAELDPAMHYQLMFGKAKMRIPQYDLRHFSNDIPKQIPTIETQNIVYLAKAKSDKKSTSIFDNKWVVWLVIGIVGIVLAIISFSMIKEMGQREE